MRDELMPSSNSSLRARSTADSLRLRLFTARLLAMPKLSLYSRPSGACSVSAADSYVPASQRAEHHVRRPGGEGQGDVARVAHPAVGPDVLAQAPGLGGAVEHGGELRAPDAGHHPRGAHRARADTDLDHVRAGGDEVAGAGDGDHVAGDDRRVRGDGADLLDRPQRARLVTVGGVDHEHVDAQRHERLGLGGRIAVDAHRHGDAQASLVVDGRTVDRRAQRAGAGHRRRSAARRRRPPGRTSGAARRGVRTRRRGQSRPRSRLELAAHHVLQLAEAVEADRVLLGEDALRPALVVDHDDGPVGPLVDQSERIADGAARPTA